MTDNAAPTLSDSTASTRLPTSLIPCEGFVGVYQRNGARGPKYLARIVAPGGVIIHIGTFENSGKAAEAHDNAARHFLKNKPEAVKFSPSLNWPDITEIPETTQLSITLLPRFLKACEEKRLAARGPNAPRRGRPPQRPLRVFHLLTLRDCLHFFVKLNANNPLARNPLHNFNDSLRELLKDHDVAYATPTPVNPDREAFEQRLQAAASEYRIRDGLADLQGDKVEDKRVIAEQFTIPSIVGKPVEMPATLTPGTAGDVTASPCTKNLPVTISSGELT